MEGCRRIERQNFEWIDVIYPLNTCSQCKPGYYPYFFAVLDPAESGSISLKNCRKQTGSVEKNFFIRPELSTFFLHGHDTKMYEQLL